MSKKKKSGKKVDRLSIRFNLIAAIINLIVAVILLIEKLLD